MAAGRIPTLIDFSPAITAKDVSVDTSRNVVVHRGAYGKIGLGKGQPDYSVTVKFVIPDDQAEFELLAEKGMNDSEDGTFTFTYTKGQETYNLHGCAITKDTVSSDQDGNADQSITFVALNRERVS